MLNELEERMGFDDDWLNDELDKAINDLLFFEEEDQVDDSAQKTLDIPKPGFFYEVRYLKGGLLTTAQKAYNPKSKSERIKLAQKINNHPLNRKFWKKPSNDFERRYFPEGIIRFNPVFTCGKSQRLAKKGEKKCYAKIWIPIKEIYTHPKLGKLIDIPKNTLNNWLKSNGNANPTSLELLQYETFAPDWSSQCPKFFEGLTLVGQRARIIPYRFICSILLSYGYSKNSGVELLGGPATGTLISPRHVLTAAHVLGHPRPDNIYVTPMHYSQGKIPEKDEITGDFDVPDALKKSQKPIGLFRIKDYMVHARYVENTVENYNQPLKSDLFDIALIALRKRLSCRRVKGRPKRLGYWGSFLRGGKTIGPISRKHGGIKHRNLLEQQTVCLSGYPNVSHLADCGINQFEGCGKINNEDLIRVYKTIKDGWMRFGYEINTLSGQSGSPVWKNLSRRGKTFHKIVGVHTDGGLGQAASGVLITPAVVGWIQYAMSQI